MEVMFVSAVGFSAAALTTLAFLPQAIKVWRTRSAGDISLATFSLLCIGIILWLVYGLLTEDAPLIAANAVTLIFALVILWVKVRSL